MKIDLLTKAQLSVINKNNLRYPLQTAEKDYFLAVVLSIIYNSNLTDKLVFKGGTAIHHLYLDQLRFSEDLDFTALAPVSITDLRAVFEPYDFLSIVKFNPSDYSLKLERLKFLGPLGQPNSIKIDIDLSQTLVMPSCKLPYRNVFDMPLEVRGMALDEICAEKVRAVNERARYRDFYDLAMAMQKKALEPSRVLDVLSRKELRKSLSRATILANFEVAAEAATSTAENLFYREEINPTLLKRILYPLINSV